MNLIQAIQFGILAMGEQKTMRGDYQVVETIRIASRLESEAAIMVAFLSKCDYPVPTGLTDVDQAVKVLRDYQNQLISDESIRINEYPLAQQVEMARLQLLTENTADENQRQVYTTLLKHVEAKPKEIDPLELAILKQMEEQIDPLLETRRDLEGFAHQYAAFLSITLTEEQLTAIECSLTEKLSVLTGAPGTGLLVTLDALMKAAQTFDGRIKFHVVSSGTDRERVSLSNRFKRPVVDLSATVQENTLVILHEAVQFDQQELVTFIESLPADARLVFASQYSTYPTQKVEMLPTVMLTKALRQSMDIKQALSEESRESSEEKLIAEDEVDQNGGRQLALVVPDQPQTLEDSLKKLRKEGKEEDSFVASNLIDQYKQNYEHERNIALSPGQSKALYDFMGEPVFAIMGRKGSGITECAKLLVDSLKRHKGFLDIQVFTPDAENNYLTKRLQEDATSTDEWDERDLYVIDDPDSFDSEELRVLLSGIAHISRNDNASPRKVLFVGKGDSPLLTKWLLEGIIPGERL